MTDASLSYRLPAKAVVLFLVMAVAGAVTLTAGLVQDPQRTWINILLESYYLVGLGLGGLVLVALLCITGARWSTPIQRVPEAMTAILPFAGLGVISVLIGQPRLYSWTGAASTELSASPLQHLWLNWPFFLTRSLLYCALWWAFAVAVVHNSRRTDRNMALTRKTNNRLSAAFLVVFGITCWLASYDWIMSLEPRWASTIFGVYNFASLFLSGLAAVILLVVCLQNCSPLRTVLTADHLHDLGTLLFAFSCFWMYTWFCQYLLIWYVDIPEETVYFRRRLHENWPYLMYLDLALNWAIPFAVLLFRSAKRNLLVMGLVALVVLAGRWVDLFLMIAPSQAGVVAFPGLIEGGLLIGAAGLFFLVFFHSLGKASLVPITEPAQV
jgi:hypothetical protein